MKRPLVFIALIAIVYASISAIFFSKVSEAASLINEKENKEISDAECEAIVVSVTSKDDCSRYVLKNASVTYEGKVYESGNISLYEEKGNSNVEAGDTIKFKGTVTLPEKARNEGGFNEESYYKSNGYELKATTKECITISSTDSVIIQLGNILHNSMKESFKNISADYSDLLQSIILGDTSELDSETKELYRDVGIGHILAISGLHISIIGMLLYKILKRSGLSYVAASLISIFMILLYVTMTGAGKPAIRAGVMLAIMIFADVCGRSFCIISAISLETACSLFISPYLIFNQSFILSHVAIISLIIGNNIFQELNELIPKEKQLFKKLITGVVSSISITLGLLPLQCYYFYQIPIYSILINLIVIPVAGILIPLSFMAGLMGIVSESLGIFFVGGSNAIFMIYHELCTMFLKLPGAILVTGKPSLLLVIIIYSVMMLMSYILIRYKKEKMHNGRISIHTIHNIEFLVTCSVVFSVYFLTIFNLSNDKTKYTMLDVGQGDCSLITNKFGKTILIDCGSSSTKNVYKNILRPYLTYNKIRMIDHLYISHTDDDHVNGVIEFLEDIKDGGRGIHIKEVSLPDINDELKDEKYKKIEILANEAKIKVTYEQCGNVKKEDGYSIEVIAPYVSKTKKISISKGTDINYMSTAFYYKEDGMTVLYTGDITEETEKDMLKRNDVRKADVLKVAHHGSKYSTSEEFLKKVKPKVATISCSKNNRYGHPTPDVLERLNNVKANIFKTMEKGQIDIVKTENGIKVKGYVN